MAIINGDQGDDRLSGTPDADVIRGRGGDDLVFGGSGDDDLMGGSGGDDIIGGRGDDQLDGARGKDDLSGGQGNDDLNGGPRADHLTGGGATDFFDYNELGDLQGDRIEDFNGLNVRPGDLIDLSDIDAVRGGSDDAFQFDASGPVGEGRVGFRDIGDDVQVIVNQGGGGPTVSLVVEDIEIGSQNNADRLDFDFDFIA
jgi:Ca2+-binding RTX toxin-like protein